MALKIPRESGSEVAQGVAQELVLYSVPAADVDTVGPAGADACGLEGATT